MAKPKRVGDNKPSVVGEVSARNLLLRVLAKTKAAVDASGSTGIVQAQDFVFTGNRVVAYNDRLSISSPLPEDTGLLLTVKADRLYKTLQKLPEEDLEFGLGSEDNLSITSKSTKALIKAESLQGDLAELLDSLDLDGLKEKGWQDLPEGFDDAISLCLFSASPDEANVAYNCLRMLEDKIVSTDNWRISQYKFPAPAAPLDYLVPSAFAKELVGRGLVQVQAGRAWAHFRDGDGLVLSVRTVDAPFPDCDKFFEVAGKTVELPAGIVKALDAVMVYAPGTEDEDRVAELHFKKGKVVCVAEDGAGRIERMVAAPGMQPPPVNVLSINPVFFMTILEHVATMKVAKSGDRVLFKAGNFSHVMNLPGDD